MCQTTRWHILKAATPKEYPEKFASHSWGLTFHSSGFGCRSVVINISVRRFADLNPAQGRDIWDTCRVIVFVSWYCRRLTPYRVYPRDLRRGDSTNSEQTRPQHTRQVLSLSWRGWKENRYSATAIKTKSVVLSPQANYTDWATATCRRNSVPTFVDRGLSHCQRGGSPTVVNVSFLDQSRYFSFK
jgi:hypothetical protein